MSKRSRYWAVWAAASVLASTYLGAALVTPRAKTPAWLLPAKLFFVPGATSAGHYQIELACEACHTAPFTSREAFQEACVGCHGADLKEANDAHPRSKFTDPRNADRVANLDATECIACHVEHQPEITQAMGVTLPRDFCFFCHEDIAKDRPSHASLAFDTCASSGCHNFHDDRALYEGFLLLHASQLPLLDKPILQERNLRAAIEQNLDYPRERYPLDSLAPAQQDGGDRGKSDVVREWIETAHARAGVNCSGCHRPATGEGAAKKAIGEGPWTDRPGEHACAACHAAETKGFLRGKHGMRLAQGLGPMRPADARLSMRAEVHDKTLGCTSCHSAHRFDTRHAAVEACQGCHDDAHTYAYKDSPHYRLWLRELAGESSAGSGVSCASCHMPRVRAQTPEGDARVLVQHNQNDTLRPNDKMIRPVCQFCHGLGFSIDALADLVLVERNFAGAPRTHIKSMEMAVSRAAEIERKRALKRAGKPVD